MCHFSVIIDTKHSKNFKPFAALIHDFPIQAIQMQLAIVLVNFTKFYTRCQNLLNATPRKQTEQTVAVMHLKAMISTGNVFSN